MPSDLTAGDLEMVIYENFEETLPFMITHQMKMLLSGKDILSKSREKLGDTFRDEDRRVVVVQFAKNQELNSDCGSSLLCESSSSGTVSQEESVSSIRELDEDFLQFEFLLE